MAAGAGLIIAAAAGAQPAGGPGSTRLNQELTLSHSCSPSGDLERNGKVGEVKIAQSSVAYFLSVPLTRELRGLAGIFHTSTRLDLAGPVPLPGRLQLWGLSLGATRTLAEFFGPGWSSTLMLRPYLSSDSSSLGDAGFSLPASLSFGYRQSPALTWNFGLNVNAQSDNPVMPILGARWDFAPSWTLAFGFPQTGVSYQASPALTLKAGARFQGGTYHVTTARAPGLGDTWLEYRDIRLGAGFDYQIGKVLTATLDGGVVVNRKFDYFDRNYDLDGKSAGYFTLSLRARF